MPNRNSVSEETIEIRELLRNWWLNGLATPSDTSTPPYTRTGNYMRDASAIASALATVSGREGSLASGAL